MTSPDRYPDAHDPTGENGQASDPADEPSSQIGATSDPPDGPSSRVGATSDPVVEETVDRAHQRLGRRRFLRGAGFGAAALVGGGLAGGVTGQRAPARAPPTATGTDGRLGPRIYNAGAPGGQPAAIGGAAGNQADHTNHYGANAGPPSGISATHLDHVTIPPVRGESPLERTIDVVETTGVIADGVAVPQWTYDGHAPGPVLRATEGDVLRLTVRNRTSHDHNLHLHGRHSPLMDGWEPIPPGEEFTYEVVAGPAGVHPYHCHTPPLAQHISMGLYGMLIVDPSEPREPAHEFVLMLSAWDLDDDGRNDVWTWNGVAGFFHQYPIKVPTGDLVRVYVANMVEYEPVASFHLHAQTFDVFRTGTAPSPDEHTDTVTMGQGERAMLEFRLPEQGRYMFHPHQHHMADNGAMGWFAAT